MILFKPLVTNGLPHPYHLDESTFLSRGIRSNFSFLFHFSMKFMSAKRIALDGTPRSAASPVIWGYSVCLCPIKRTPGLYLVFKSSFDTKRPTF